MRTAFRRPCFGLMLLAAGLALSASGCNTTSGWARNQVGKRNFTSGNYTAARRSFEQALMNDPWNADYAFNVAAAMQKQGDLLAAERMYEHALTLNPSHQPSYHSLAGLLNEQGRAEEAQDLLTAWVDTQPYMPESHVEMAWMQQELGDYAAAEASLQQALARNPRHARAMAQLGQVYEMTGRRTDAAALYNRSLAYNRMQPQVAARLNAFGGTPAASPALIMAGQLPQYGPLYAQPQVAASPAMNAAPYTAMMPTNPPTPLANWSGSPAMTNAQGAWSSGWMDAGMMNGGMPLSGPMQVIAAPTSVPQAQPSAPVAAFAPSAMAVSPPTTIMQVQHTTENTSSAMPGAPIPTNVTTFDASPAMSPVPPAIPAPALSNPPVQFGAPQPISQNPASGIPAISAIVPVVTAF